MLRNLTLRDISATEGVRVKLLPVVNFNLIALSSTSVCPCFLVALGVLSSGLYGVSGLSWVPPETSGKSPGIVWGGVVCGFRQIGDEVVSGEYGRESCAGEVAPLS